jgi:DNA-binding transcriptional regulator YiaG
MDGLILLKKCPLKRTHMQEKKVEKASGIADDMAQTEMTDEEIQREIQRVTDRLKNLAGEEYGGQSELARAIGVPRQRLSDWLTGRRTPDLAAWLKIQMFLKRAGKKRGGEQK